MPYRYQITSCYRIQIPLSTCVNLPFLPQTLHEAKLEIKIPLSPSCDLANQQRADLASLDGVIYRFKNLWYSLVAICDWFSCCLGLGVVLQNLRPSDYDLIPDKKEALHGISYRSVPEILKSAGRSIQTINETGIASDILLLLMGGN
ncbi:hypothetical protein AVEN_25637-1 [Araneus ventricosus]|uniref:Uncharacterized protein n=1 Tax=Araneus ventricosus TaxID=182803 RepID=A0A4Y2BQD2_ARAVE|nr:hypothetical protein AVEN_25637-1 [Araneus ventricosus]